MSSIFVLSYIQRLVEQPFGRLYNDWKDDLFIDKVYMTVITIVTVGYGDFTPFTRFGKIVTIFTTFWGGYLISILIVSVNGKSHL